MDAAGWNYVFTGGSATTNFFAAVALEYRDGNAASHRFANSAARIRAIGWATRRHRHGADHVDAGCRGLPRT